MELKLVNTSQGGSDRVISVADKIFGKKFNEGLIHQVVCASLAALRAGTRAQKSRSEVSGGGTKPWKQKGTGRARAGTIRSPIWRGGGVAFPEKTHDFSQKVNKKMYRGALCSILSELVRQDRLLVTDDFSVLGYKTKDLIKKLNELNIKNVLIIVNDVDTNLCLAARNLKDVEVCDLTSSTINPVDLINFEKVLFTLPALNRLQEKLA